MNSSLPMEHDVPMGIVPREQELQNLILPTPCLGPSWRRREALQDWS